jgi:hypothetical protein
MIATASANAARLTTQTASAAERALSLVARLSASQLRDAQVFSHEVSDTSNPGGYYHRSVTLRYRMWFGLMYNWVIYHQPTAFDEDEQHEVKERVQGLLDAIDAAL